MVSKKLRYDFIWDIAKTDGLVMVRWGGMADFRVRALFVWLRWDRSWAWRKKDVTIDSIWEWMRSQEYTRKAIRAWGFERSDWVWRGFYFIHRGKGSEKMIVTFSNDWCYEARRDRGDTSIGWEDFFKVINKDGSNVLPIYYPWPIVVLRQEMVFLCRLQMVVA